LTNFEGLAGAHHLVFLRIYNADRFRSKIEDWLPDLDLSQAHLLIADNCSSDNSTKWLATLAKKLPYDVTLIRNEKNFGGYGNLSKNLPRFSNVKWVTTLHQDDFYLSAHVRSHREVIEASSPDVGMICSEAKSVSEAKRTIPYPRASWLIGQDADPVTIFLANLKHHTYPFSGATFSREVLERYPIPWHSTAFPDTEIVMKMCVEYKFRFSSEVTVEYLENVDSESHSLSSNQREFGAFQALIRVFSHPNYKALCELVEKENQPAFIDALVSGLSQRISDEYLRLLLTQSALEITAGYMGTFPELATHLSRGYLSIGDQSAVNVLVALGARDLSHRGTEAKASESITSPTKSSMLSAIQLRTLGALPMVARKGLFRSAMKTKLGKKLFPVWNFDWRRR